MSLEGKQEFLALREPFSDELSFFWVAVGIKAELLKLYWKELPAPGKLMSMGRQQRYTRLLESCVAKQIPFLLTGHHRDDQIETVSLPVQGFLPCTDLIRSPDSSFSGLECTRGLKGSQA